MLPLDEAGKELISKPLDALRSITNLIENVRKLQRQKEGGLKTDLVDLGNALHDLCGQYNAPENDIVIELASERDCRVMANGLIKDVFANLISNAIKHSDGKKPIIVTIRLSRNSEAGKKYCRIDIEDNGPGIRTW